MSVRLFAGYFLALAACSTIAFASSWADNSPSQSGSSEQQEQPLLAVAPPALRFHTHRAALKHLQIAQAE